MGESGFCWYPHKWWHILTETRWSRGRQYLDEKNGAGFKLLGEMGVIQPMEICESTLVAAAATVTAAQKGIAVGRQRVCARRSMCIHPKHIQVFVPSPRYRCFFAAADAASFVLLKSSLLRAHGFACPPACSTNSLVKIWSVYALNVWRPLPTPPAPHIYTYRHALAHKNWNFVIYLSNLRVGISLRQTRCTCFSAFLCAANYILMGVSSLFWSTVW